MSSVVIAGDVSGSVTLQAPSAAGTTTLTLPTTSGTIITTASTPSFAGNISFSTADAGIVFNKTGALTNSTLDDYEVGTWTPTVSGQTSSGTGTYSAQTGTYVKIGKVVTITYTLVWSAHTGTGYGRLTNLPFTTAASSSYEWLNIMECNNYTMPASTYPVILASGGGNSYCNLYTGAIGTGSLTQLTLDTAASIYGSLTYQTS